MSEQLPRPLPPIPPTPRILCPLCRQIEVEKNNAVCPGCQLKAKIAKFDALAEKCALECMAQMTRCVKQGDLSAADAAAYAWDMGISFAQESIRRANPK